MDKQLYAALHKKLQSKYDNFPKNTQDVAFALAEVMGLPKSLVIGATSEMVSMMIGVMYLKELDKGERTDLAYKIQSYLMNTDSANSQRFGSAMRYNFKLVSQGKKDMAISWSLDEEEMGEALGSCETYSAEISTTTDIIGLGLGAVSLSSKVNIHPAVMLLLSISFFGLGVFSSHNCSYIIKESSRRSRKPTQWKFISGK